MINQKRYFELVQRYPELFSNPSADGITIELNPEKIQQIEQTVMQRLSEQGLPTEWGNVGIAYEDQYLLLLRDAVYFGNGKPGTYIRSIQEASAPGVIILPVYQDRIVLTHHFRHATRSWHLELPRGFGLPTMSSEENARRELYEEIGASTATLHYLGRAHADTGMSTNCNEFFFARIQNYGPSDRFEGINKLELVTISELERLIRENSITDSFTIIAYTQAKLHNML
ncbi:ADP-ribose pyrophosphatase [Reticulibacter mediterranei]|uniref:ADP-ribose pyrophosphatase n=1 Tax=Reticulibacter mediterranei TaxID=2778369 RepID=A0A8J3IZT6_9CHLR|nr:NUDIX hydrolase [Reticulibacter mediterranei]GHO98986.1 ADP-ribose pyrophosphatase [Reticulibacter mediterranei]